MLEKEPQINTVSDMPEDEIILSEVPDKGIFFETLLNKVSEKLEKLKVKKSLIENRILGLINKGRIYWKGVKLFRKNPPTTHPPSFFYQKTAYLKNFLLWINTLDSEKNASIISKRSNK